jgi:hypothetical protein
MNSSPLSQNKDKLLMNPNLLVFYNIKQGMQILWYQICKLNKLMNHLNLNSNHHQLQ